ncbi:SET and MYND domain-containing protein 4 [Apis mellifera caucasica]|nr:SET and MYND domain-containing protein 4 [Apis mellifera caucasica]KAG9434393.1 SET and MYND domain-containing protein 4 [Apis mellifera carnica]
MSDFFVDPPIVSKRQKCGKNQLMDLMVQGEIKMVEGRYSETVDICTRGLQQSLPFSAQSAILYFIRAEALENLQMYEESLLDIDRAIEISVSKTLTDILQKKRIDILKEAACFKPQKMRDRCQFENIPQLSNNHHKYQLGLSDAIDLIHNGRYFVAVKPIKMKDVILIDKSQITHLHKDDWDDDPTSNMCHYCFKYCRALIPCDYCYHALYCSKECRGKAYQAYHQIYCRYGNLDNKSSFVLKLLLKITDNGARLKEALEYHKELENMSEEMEKKVYNLKEMKENNLRSILNLSIPMKKDDNRTEDNLFYSAKIAMLLRNHSNYMQGSNDILNLTKLLCRLCYIYDIHARMDFVPIFERYIALLQNLYFLLNLVRHSCSGNTIYTVHKNNVLVLRAAKDIYPGELITFNFMSKYVALESNSMPRNVMLKNFFDISCDCEACAKSYKFKPELGTNVDIPNQLQQRLQKCRIDIDAMWELLKIINNSTRKPCLEVEILKYSISDAYYGEEYFVSIYYIQYTKLNGDNTLHQINCSA